MRIFLTVIAMLLTACSSPTLGPSSQTLRVKLPPDQAAACFARNAEEHSGALNAEVSRGRDRAQVVVRVRNGVLYATADFDRSGAGSTARLTLNVTTTGRRSDLVDALLEGC